MHRYMHREKKQKKQKKQNPCSSVVERPPFKRVAVGSNPTKDNLVPKRIKQGTLISSCFFLCISHIQQKMK